MNTCLDEHMAWGRTGIYIKYIVNKYILLSGQLPSTFYESQYVLKPTVAIMWLKLARFSAV